MNQQIIQQKQPNPNKRFWIGLGVGFLTGGAVIGTTCYCVSKNKERKRADERLKREKRTAYIDGCNEGREKGHEEGYAKALDDMRNNNDAVVKSAYDKGYKDGINDSLEETQKWIDANCIQVDQSELGNSEAVLKAVEAYQKRSDGSSGSGVPEKPEAVKTALQSQTEAYTKEEDYAAKGEKQEKATSESKNEVAEMFQSPVKQQFSGRQYMIQTKDGETLSYPIEIFCDVNGFLGVAQARENLREYEKNPAKLKLVWEAMGWGEYYPEYEDGIPPAEVINNWNVSIDDVSEMMDDQSVGSEPEEKTIERERYLDEVERYRSHPEEAPRIISRQEFEDESHLEHIYIDYYDVDNVFLDPQDKDKPVDSTIAFGVADGKELFRNREDSDDPDVVYVKNFGQNIVAEITRWHKSSSGLMDGSAYLNGETGSAG